MNSNIKPLALGEIMNRTVAIYGKKFLSFVLLCAIIQVPLGLLGVLSGASVVHYAIVAIISIIAFPWLYAVLSLAVVQYLNNGEVKIIQCYFRVGTCMKSLIIVPPLLITTILFDIGVLYIAFRVDSMVMMVVPLLASVVAFVNMGLVICSVTIERTKPWNALFHGWILLKESLFRSLGMGVIILVISMGFALVLVLPFAVANSWSGMVIDGILTKAAWLTASILVAPLGGIALTLLYCDLRMRRGDQDREKLVNQMSLALV